MKDESRGRALRRRLGPVGLSLVAAAVTAVGFAAVSLAQDTGKSNSPDGQSATAPGPPNGQSGARTQFHAPSAADRQKMEQFRQCMEDNGAPAPPDPQSGERPQPPSGQDREKVQKAFEACKDKLPEDLQDLPGPPPPGGPGCGPGGPGGPPPGAQGQNGSQGRQGQQNQEQSAPGYTAPGGSAS
jgi:hypothetical protein